MKFNNELFFEAMNEIAERNLLDRDELNKIIENAFFKTFHSKIDPDARLELFVDFKNKKFQLINHSKLVVSDDEYEEKYRSLEISISEAKKTKKDIKVGDEFSEEVDLFQNTKFSSQVKQLITQIVREKRKEAVYNKHKSIKGEMVEATLLSLENNGNAIFKLNDDTIAFMPAKFRNMNIKLNIGGKTKLYVEDVLEESKDSQIIVSNGSPTIIKRIIEKNVPEVEEGIVEIVKISRIAGTRSKVSVKSNNENVDPVGAIIGSGGNRIKSILEKLSGEKIDIINWSDKIETHIANSISPARVVSILDKKDEDGNIIKDHKIVITPNIHQTLAIGKNGSNARLAVELTNTRIDIISIDQANEKGIDIIWNGNVKKEELSQVESNSPKSKNNYQRNAIKKDKFDFDSDISSFNEDIQSNENFGDYNDQISEDQDFSLSEEEIKQMESNFEIDKELLDFGMEEKDESK